MYVISALKIYQNIIFRYYMVCAAAVTDTQHLGASPQQRAGVRPIPRSSVSYICGTCHLVTLSHFSAPPNHTQRLWNGLSLR